MEYLDEYDDSRPRFVLQSRTIDTPPENSLKDKPLLITSLALSLLSLTSSFFLLHSPLLHSLLLWLSLSLLVGPFAPLHLTAGDPRVGQGPAVDFPPPQDHDVIYADKKGGGKRNKGKRSDLYETGPLGSVEVVGNSVKVGALGRKNDDVDGGGGEVEEREWSEEDLGLLRKAMGKHPVGKPRRWEVIAEVFKGRHGVESVISAAKGLGKAKPEDSDSFTRFLKDRKGRVEVEGGSEEGVGGGKEGSGGSGWSSGEDMALLNALKTFPKDVAMRWEKIAAAVPGKTKAGCMKRVVELKKEFRSSKGATET